MVKANLPSLPFLIAVLLELESELGLTINVSKALCKDLVL